MCTLRHSPSSVHTKKKQLPNGILFVLFKYVEHWVNFSKVQPFQSLCQVVICHIEPKGGGRPREVVAQERWSPKNGLVSSVCSIVSVSRCEYCCLFLLIVNHVHHLQVSTATSAYTVSCATCRPVWERTVSPPIAHFRPLEPS